MVTTTAIYEVIKKNRVIGMTDNPHFEKAHREDWRNCVPDDIRQLWPSMSIEARIMVYMMASRQANTRNLD